MRNTFTSDMKVGAGLGLACTMLLAFTLAVDAQPRRGRRDEKKPAAPAGQPLEKSEKQFPTGTVWVLKAFNDKPVPGTEELTFSIDSAYRGTGYSGCNTWSATIFPVKNQTLAVGPVALTKKKCDAATMKFENTYLIGIHAGPTWDLVGSNDGTELIMKGQGGTLRFIRSL